MSDKRDERWFLKVSKERAEKAEADRTLDDVANAIGERRSRDLIDIVATTERTKGWNTALEYLISAADKNYSTPASFGKQETRIEPLKYREMIFTLFSCEGLEPIQIDTLDFIRMVESKSSLADASKSLMLYTQETAIKQIEAGDTLYFNILPTQKFDELSQLIEEARIEEIGSLTLRRDGKNIDLTQLWHSEYGRLALSDLGIKGTSASMEQLDMVLSVIQVSPDVKERIRISETIEPSNRDVVKPANQMYRELHKHIIDHDIDGLISKGSKHSLFTLNALLNDAVTRYATSESSDDYRHLLQCINSHVAIRNLDSITSLEKLLRIDNQRVVTPSISALGNLYHESSAQAIIDLLCKTSDDQIISVSLTALENILKKSPETLVVIEAALNSECKNRRHLRRFLKSTSSE